MIGRRITTIITKTNELQDAIDEGQAINNSNHEKVMNDMSETKFADYHKDTYKEWLEARVKAAKKFGSRTGIFPSNERKVTNMSTNDTMEITRKVSRSDVRFWGSTQEEVEMELYMRRKRVFELLDRKDYRTLNDAYQTLVISESREGLTLGWEFVTLPSKAMTDLFIWAFCADGTVELTFHNLKDISDLYPSELTLSVKDKLSK